MEKGITLETLNEKHLKKKQEAQRQNMEQDDRFFFIAGYTSGGAPYGITWEEMKEHIDDGAEPELVEVNHDALPFD